MITSFFRNRTSEENATALPMSFAQEGLWFLDQLEPKSAAYNIPIAIHLRGLLEVEALERSLNAILLRHEALRTTFRVIEGQPMQVIAPTLDFGLPVVDLRGLPEAEALRLATEEAQRPFDLTQGPLIRATVLHLGVEEYVLLLSMHRIVSDDRSVGVLFQELTTLYEAFSTGQPSPLPELPIQYADFAVWQREMLQGDLLAEQLAYWKQHLAGMPEGLELPTDRPRLPVPTSRGAAYFTTLPRELTDALKDLCFQEGMTLYMTLVAAFQTLLHRYTGQDDLVIGTIIAGRARAESEALIGLFENTLVLRTNLSGDLTFRELLGRVREIILEAQAHQDLPFEHLVKELHSTRSFGQNPLFQVSLTLDPAMPSLPSGWTLTQMEVDTGTSRFDLTLELDDRLDGLIGRFEYSTDLFDQETIARMAGHWQTLLEGVVANPTQRLVELPLLTEMERHQLLSEWNDTAMDYPKDLCLHQLFEAQVERTPEAVAVVFGDEQVTYRELNRRANQLARHLQELGVGTEVLVGLCVERSPEMVVGLLGILKAGGAYVPLDPTYPTERITFMLTDAQVPVLVTQQHLSEHFPAHPAQVVCLDSDAAVLAQQSKANLMPVTTSDNLVYVIYTSGSTGRPKGVQILHRAVVNFLMSMLQQPGLTAEDTLLAVTTLSFDIAALELFLPLIVGARLIIASSDAAANGEALAEMLNSFHVTVLQATPVTWRILLASGWYGDRRLKILCGGEALPLELAQQLQPKATSLWNMYGPTETTIWSAVCKIEPTDEVISIGHPIANTSMYLLDAHLQLVPVGVPGELYIGGDGLARGYLYRPELTAERFIHHPFSDEPGSRLYKTGDLARYRADGTIEVIGRLDHQVKLRGFRIELGEIEMVLSRHPAVRQAVVVAREDTPDRGSQKRLVAYVILDQEQTATVANLQSHVMKQLPSYMVPSAFVLLEALPLTPNGKIDRRALPAPNPARAPVKEAFVAPTLPVHHKLVQLWEDLLDVRPIGIRDNFFDLGGHSLLAARMINLIEQVCGRKLPLSTLFDGATIEHLAQALQEKEYSNSRTPLVAVQAAGSRRPFFFLHGDYLYGAFYCSKLAHDLGSDQPFYVLEPYKFDDLQVPPTFEAMAAAHLKSIRTVQPEGPYLLGGWCNGGLVAYEIARQLHAEGQTVALLVLMDPWSSSTFARLICGFIRCIGNLIGRGQDKQLDLFLRLQHVYRWLRYSDYRNSQSFLLAPIAQTTRQNEMDIFDWVVYGYIPGHYPGKITFFWDSEEPSRRRGWRKMTTRAAENHIIPGNHLTSRTEYLHVLAERLRICLSKA